MFRRVAFLLVLGILAVPAGAQELPVTIPDDVGVSSERLERLTSTFQNYVDDGQLPGAVVLVTRGEQVVYHGAFGMLDREQGIPMPADAIFRIASQSKAVVSVGVMILQERGQLLISDRLGKYLPEWAETTVAVAKEGGGYEVEKANRPITIRQLLTHTAGVDYGYGPAAEEWKAAGIQGWYFAHLDEPIRETVRRMAALPQAAQPNTAFVYGYNTDILGALIEVVDGRPLDRFVREEIFEPLGMHDTHFYLPREKAGRLATVYSLREGSPLERAPDASAMEAQGAYVDGPRTSFSGGAGLLSTARDYARFLQMVLNGGELFGNRILSPTTVDQMARNHVQHLDYGKSGGFGMGLGFGTLDNAGLNGQPVYEGQLSWGGAYHSTYWLDPVQDLVVVYFTQVLPAAGLDDHAKLRTLVYQALVD